MLEDVSEERRGPRVGAPDQAIQGFLKGAGLSSLDQAQKRDTGKGEFWFAVVEKKGGPTAEVLPGIIEAAMKALPWPKAMRWGSSTMQWVRPLQGIVALFDGKTLRGEIDPGGGMAPVKFGDTIHTEMTVKQARESSKGDRGVVTFDVKGGKEAAFKALNRLNIVDISNNLGDSKSMVTHPATTTHMRIGAEERAKLGITDGTVRISVGLEDVADIIDDLHQALGQ